MASRVPQSSSKIADKILRLHVIANSDTAADQNLKVEMRSGSITGFTDSRYRLACADMLSDADRD